MNMTAPRVVDKVNHAWGVRMGTQLRNTFISPTCTVTSEPAKGHTTGGPLAQDAQLQQPRKTRIPCRSRCLLVTESYWTTNRTTHSKGYIGHNLRFTIYVYMYICIDFAIFSSNLSNFLQLVWKVEFSIYKIVSAFFCCFNSFATATCRSDKKLCASGFHPTVNPCPCVPVRVATHAWVSDTFISPTRFLINEVSLCWTCATLLIQTIFQSPWVWDDIFWFPCIPVAPVQKTTLTSGLLRLFQIRVVLQNRDHVGFVQHFFGPTVK